MKMSKTIRLFWWSEPHLMGKTKENYGDLIGAYIVQCISKKKVIWTHPKRWHLKDYFSQIYVTAGSILAHVNRKCIVWGSGIIKKDQDVKSARFLAVRGPQTRNNLLAQGFKVPEVYGDPALLLPLYYKPQIEKKYRLGIVPHYTDFREVYDIFNDIPDVLVIDLMTTNIETTTDLFLQCENIISSSLHGLIIPHAYSIPAIWVEFSDKLFGDGIKFQDYFESVAIVTYKPIQMQSVLQLNALLLLFDRVPSLPETTKIKQIQDDLMRVCPFKS